MTPYIHKLPGWPSLTWSQDALASSLADVRHRQGRLLGRLEALGVGEQDEAVLRTLTTDVLTSSAIEGEVLDADQVRSSVARRLGLDIGGLIAADRHVEGVVEMMLDATRGYDQPLTDDRLFAWHAAMFPTGRSGMHRITVGGWRTDSSSPMQVVSGPVGRERVHLEAPAAARLPEEMRAFLDWFNADAGGSDPVMKAAHAHFWFVTVHPFDDGNGRIARAIADMALARAEGSPRRFYSMSAEIRHQRDDYYRILEQTQRGTLDITPWMAWFLQCLGRAIDGAQATLGGVLDRSRVWERLRDVPLNDRQRTMITRLLDGFEGKLTTSKWATLTRTSPDTALRDILALVQAGVLVKSGAGGRSTSYALAPMDHEQSSGQH
jgi:Fic family protein